MKTGAEVMKSRRSFYWMAGLLATTIAISAASAQQTTVQIQFDIAPQPLKYALRNVTRASGFQLFAMSSDLAGKSSPGLHGRMSTQEALDQLLAGSGLTAQIDGGSVFIRGRSQAPAGGTAGEPEIVVTGSHIQSRDPSSNLIRRTQQQMVDAGYSNLGDAVRSIPQNFGGGQSPGVAFGVPQSSGENVGGGSAIDLRGIGQDATLTLIDGRRLVYGGYRQSTDVSSIPLLAVDRVEIVPDGASAIYGSDAVAGVANIILKRDYKGLATLARLGGSTDGGDHQEEYSAVAGTTWASGGFLAAYDFERDTPVVAGQRSYTATTNPGLTLYPYLKHHSAVMKFHHKIGSKLEFELFSLYNKRWSSQAYSITGLTISPSYQVFAKTTTLAVSPSLTYRPDDNWQIELIGTTGFDHVYYGTDQIYLGTSTTQQRSCFCNTSRSVEVEGDGQLFMLPAGALKVAAGGSYRNNSLHSFDIVGDVHNADDSQDDYFAYAELSAPLLSPDQHSLFGYKASLDAAMRVEDYPGIDKVVTPKLGLVYAPSPDIDLKATWGKSFKAPTLYQLYNSQYAAVYSASSFGGRGPVGSTVITLAGGNTNLKPERAETWSATFDMHPRAIPGLRASIGYFHIRYRDRIVSPISSYTNALNDPRYSDLIASDPAASAVDAAIAGRTLYNFTGATFDPASVVAIIDNRSQNVAGQTLQGVDVSASYHLATDREGIFDAMVDLTYLNSTQRLSARQAELPLSGTIFNPPHWRGRAGLSWTMAGITLSSFVNYIGVLYDPRFTPSPRIGAQATVDLTALYRLPVASGFLHGIELAGTVRNLGDRKPGLVRSNLAYQATYDSTNYSPLGRVISFSIKKDW